MNIPNQLTVFRLIITIPFVFLLSVQFPWAKTGALVLFLLGVFSDYADGVIARKYGLITDFGKLMDPLTDKIMTAAAFICLTALNLVPAWAVIVIVAREFLITGLRLIALSKQRVLPAEKLGKYKTATQMICILLYLILLSASDFGSVSGALGASGAAGTSEASLLKNGGWLNAGQVLIYLTVLLTLWSGCSYLAKNWDLIRDAG